MDTMNDNIITECLAICDNIDDDHVDKFFPKFDKCLELSKNTGLEKKLFQKSLLGLVRKCRQDFLRETKMSFRDVTEIANDFSEVSLIVFIDMEFYKEFFTLSSRIRT